MKFGCIVGIILTLVAARFAAGADCPLEHAFMSATRTGTINPNRMESIAGLAASRTTAGALWPHNSGSINRIFALETGSRAMADYTLDRTLVDAQDIAVGPGAVAGSHVIYLGDIGGVRETITVARFAEPNLIPPPSGVLPAPAQTYFTVSYPDGAHDARALMVDPVSNDLFIVTFEELPSRVYRITQQALTENGTMTLVGTLLVQLVTA